VITTSPQTRPPERRGFSGVAIASAAAAAVLSAGFAGAAFGLQAIALPRPTRGQLIAAKTLRWLTHQQAIESEGVTRRGPISTRCFDASALVGTPARRVRASLLITPTGQWVDTRSGSFRVGRMPTEIDGPWIALAAARAGCPTALERRIGRFLDQRRPVRAVPVYEHRTRLLLLQFAGPKYDLGLLVDPLTSTPLAVRLGPPHGAWRYLSAPGPA
jgi:hypothetical protein